MLAVGGTNVSPFQWCAENRPHLQKGAEKNQIKVKSIIFI